MARRIRAHGHRAAAVLLAAAAAEATGDESPGIWSDLVAHAQAGRDDALTEEETETFLAVAGFSPR